jgi:hypothetical protein
MSAFLQFDATQVNPNDEYTPIPAGSYPVIITDSEIRDTKNGQGNYLKVTLEVQAGEYQGRKIFHNITLQNQNQTAVSIGQRHLSQICHAVGILQVQDSAQLHHKPLIAVVKIRKGNDGYNDSNEVARYEPAQGMPQAGPVPTFQSPPRQAAPQPQAAAAPWAAGR